MAGCKVLYEKDVPRIYATIKAMHKMRYYIDNTDMEIGWLGYVTKIDDTTYLIEDVFLLKQKVHSTTTEIDPEALASLATDLIRQGDDGISLYNKIRLWGHSHVNMDTFASGQDDKQMDEFATSDFYIRLIGNKKGKWNVCLYDYANNILWSELQLELYYEVDVSDEELDKEIEDNVSKIEYTVPKTAGFVGREWWRQGKFDDYDNYYDDFYGYPTKETVNESQAERLRNEKEEEEKEEEIPYEINGKPSHNDFRHMKKYYSQDENTCLFMWTAGEAEVEAVVYEDYGVHLTPTEVKDLIMDMQDIYERKFCMPKI